MNRTIATGLAALAAGVSMSAPAAGARGFLGVEYAEAGGGYQDLSGNGMSLDGWMAGAAINGPILDPDFGVDFNAGIDYMRLTGDGITANGYAAAALFRFLFPLDQPITPYLEAGLGWSRFEFSGAGRSETASGFSLPLGAGVELVAGPFSIAPFFTYTFGLESDIDDSWSAGVKGGYWLTSNWGANLTIAHTQFDDALDGLRIFAAFTLAF